MYHTNRTVVMMDLWMQEIAEMDHSRRTVKVNVIISTKWKDEFLTWNPDEYGGERSIIIPADQIWIPEVVIREYASKQLMTSSSSSRPLMARVNSSGSVSLDHPKQLQADCSASPEGFWSTRYDCEMNLLTWLFRGDEVLLQGGAYVAAIEKHPFWEVESPKIKFLHHGMECLMVLRKKYEASLSLPTAALVLITLATFWLPTSAPRITLCCANLLVTVIWLCTVADHHVGSIYTAPHVTFLSLSAVLAAVSLAIALATYKFLDSADRCEAPRGLVRLLDAPFWQLLCVGGFQPDSAAAARETEMEQLSHDPLAATPSTSEEPRQRRREEWQSVSRAIDRALFAAFVVTFISFAWCSLVHTGGHALRRLV
uniref:Neurotransmitter-gated ion-channel ligand-binding domain-containing protein n=1 Tax=Amblyomma maculatum TaxID=34609 RepID=G3MS48_AMBMU